MLKRTAQKREVDRDACATAERERATATTRNRDGCATILERADFLILLGLAVVTFGIYAQVIGHHFITLDDLSYIEDNPMVNRGVTLCGTRLGVYHFSRGKLASAHMDFAH